MSSDFSTPDAKGKESGGKSISPYMASSIFPERAKAVDLVTGKAKVEYFFDPLLILDENTTIATGAATPFKTPSKRNQSKGGDSSDSLLYSSKHLYAPCTIVKSLQEDGDDPPQQHVGSGGNARRNNKKKNKKKNGFGGNNNNRRASTDATFGPALVKTSDGTLYKIQDASKLIALTSPDDYIGVKDVLHLTSVSEASLLHTLRIRYKRDAIYTNAGPILLSVNPYKVIMDSNGESLYSEKKMLHYRTSENFVEEEPHLFQVADRAYSAMMDSVHIVPHLEDEDVGQFVASPSRLGVSAGQVVNQSIIISGESGAGKTEATKYIMQYLARITKKKKWKSEDAAPFLSPDGKVISTLEDRVLSSNPLLEAFGNAQTLRNDNSSRFGKFIHIMFSTDKGIIVGAQIRNYLLEKTRITTQIEGERNYHIFYQLFSGLPSETLAELGLDGGTKVFRYLGNREMQKGPKEEQDFRETLSCLSNIGVGFEEGNVIFGLVAAVLHLGNISFEESGEEDHAAVISEASRPSLCKACQLLGLQDNVVGEAILTKLLTINGKTIKKPSTRSMAEDKRDALAKLIYSSVFLWLVESINKTLSLEQNPMSFNKANTGFIGCLDIYGFECFSINGYEQFLINYCNEKLQRHFNRHLFEVEQNLYSMEGVDWTYISFNDNQPCLDLIEGGGGVVGILNTLDDSYAGMGSSDEKDIKFVAQLHKQFGSVAGTVQRSDSNQYFVTPKFGNDRQFVIVHYAGEVTYTADGFAEKNMESLSNELRDLGSTSSNSLVRGIFGGAQANADSLSVANRRSSIRGFSVSSQFKQSLQSLVDDLEKTQPHYIRCVKPNLSKAPKSFNSGEVLKQLRYSGMMEAIRIRKEGYALREDHQSFFNRFSVLLGANEVNGEVNIEQLVSVLSKRLYVTDQDWQIGHSKIFLRRELSEKLERLARLRVHRAARTLGRFGRAMAHCRASLLLTAWARFQLVMRRHRKVAAASSLIASTFKMYKQRRRFKATVSSVIAVQSFLRMVAAKQTLRKLRDPFCDMSMKELDKLYKQEKQVLDRAVMSKDYAAAAASESRLERISEAIEKLKPMTRNRLEFEIAEVTKRLDEALSQKDYKSAAPLQDRLDQLVVLRIQYPTIEELREELTRTERQLAEATEKRDFSAAASLQEAVVVAQERLKVALKSENEDSDTEEATPFSQDSNTSTQGIENRRDLEKKLSDLHVQVETSIDKKDFKHAAELQSQIEQVEKLRSLFPSLEELSEELRRSNQQLEAAISRKNFEQAAQLHEEIALIEKKIEAERKDSKEAPVHRTDVGPASAMARDGRNVYFESRIDLENEIKSQEKLQGDMISSKQFKDAQEIQKYIERLEEIRPLLPTTSEIKSAIKKKREQMGTAISEKRFVDAESIDKEISILEEKLEKENKHSLSAKANFSSSMKIKGSDISVNSAPAGRSPVPKIKRSETVCGPMAVPPFTIKSKNLDTDKSDDVSDITSIYTSKSRKGNYKRSHIEVKTSNLESLGEDRSVSKLRPKKPLVSSINDSVLSVTQMLSSKRGDASLVVNSEGGLAGIITDTDITRRLVANQLDASETRVSEVMTPNPTCVSMTDSAMDAMTTMVENHFRHLPVVDDKGGVVGLLDIAKCLNDAITKLEKSQSKNSNAAQEAVHQAVKAQGVNSSQAAVLQALLGPLMTQAFGTQSSPTLRSLLAGKPKTVVSPSASLLEAGIKMAESKKAALVVEDGRLVGIFGFKDMMNRVIAKGLPLEDTQISSVMTPNPEFVGPEMSVLEALQTMHDNKFLTLPVCEDDGTVVGLVNVMDVIYGCGGAEGWRSIFSNTLDLDDLSDAVSTRSGNGSTAGSRFGGSTSESLKSRSLKSKSFPKEEISRPVSKLMPKKPLVSSINDSVLSVTQMLSSKRGDASLVVNSEGGLAGIITDTDITRRLVANQLDASETRVSEVMTPNPTCVSMTDSAMDAMTTMVENHFRHLPVVDDKGGVVGLLDIAKCLNDAITKLEKSQSKNSNAAQEAVHQAVKAQGVNSSQAAVLQALLGPLMTQAFGTQSSPTLRSLLAGKPKTVVSPSASLLEAGIKMAESKKAALVVEDGRLVGIFGFKDMMNRVIAKGLPLEDTQISSVMTPNPEFVGPEMSVLEALQTMHDNKFLTLPVCEDDGTVVGLVNVMDVIYGCGGAEGWRSIFSNTLDLDDLSDTASHWSEKSNIARFSNESKTRMKHATDKTVAKLRPKKAVLSSSEATVFEVVKSMATNRVDSSVVVDSSAIMEGIVTDTDIARRVVAKGIDATVTSISAVMTRSPKYVSLTDSACDALVMMIENRFRHLPVMDVDGNIVGTLDIAKCLNDAISKLERHSASKISMADNLMNKALDAADGVNATAVKAILRPLLSQAFGEDSDTPTMQEIIEQDERRVLSLESTAFDAAILMAETRKAALVVDGNELVGLFSFRDLMSRVVANGLDPSLTSIAEVMTPDPEFVLPDMTALEALQLMHDNKFLTLPICSDSGAVVGLVDVMDVIHACGDASHWRAMFDASLDIEEPLEIQSTATPALKNNVPLIKAAKGAPMVSSAPNIPSNIPSTLEFENGVEEDFDDPTLNDTLRFDAGSLLSEVNVAVFKIVDQQGHTHRIRSEARIMNLKIAFAEKTSLGRAETKDLRFKFVDEEGDAILVSSDEDLAEAIHLSRNSAQNGSAAVRLLVDVKRDTTISLDPNLMIAGAAATLVAIGAAMIIMFSSKPTPTRY
ncbi:cystathionine beta synthase domain containing protein [Nitzschia inconspicua]|uniref:Cystathionine beta synthase domain containing protein n=1 Tax=Nitzschia inconspicua TaxID=303405 RepID=A0A9K3PRQ6_9STRA|nr:cystathionine beta synthase domain containing protein [Nitzschia inconspicua]